MANGMDSFIYHLVYTTDSSNRILLMVKINGYKVNEPRKAAEVRVCNCIDGHQNCKCDGKTGKKIR